MTEKITISQEEYELGPRAEEFASKWRKKFPQVKKWIEDAEPTSSTGSVISTVSEDDRQYICDEEEDTKKEFQLALPIPDDKPQPDADLTQQAEDEFPEDEYHGYDSPIEDSPFEDPDYDEDNDDPRGYNEDERNLHYLSPFDGMNL